MNDQQIRAAGFAIHSRCGGKNIWKDRQGQLWGQEEVERFLRPQAAVRKEPKLRGGLSNEKSNRR